MTIAERVQENKDLNGFYGEIRKSHIISLSKDAMIIRYEFVDDSQIYEEFRDGKIVYKTYKENENKKIAEIVIENQSMFGYLSDIEEEGQFDEDEYWYKFNDGSMVNYLNGEFY